MYSNLRLHISLVVNKILEEDKKLAEFIR